MKKNRDRDFENGDDVKYNEVKNKIKKITRRYGRSGNLQVIFESSPKKKAFVRNGEMNHHSDLDDFEKFYDENCDT